MVWQKINIQKYVSEVKRNMNLEVPDELIEKDLLLTLILAEFQKEKEAFSELVFKGGTLLSRNYLKYHRFSEDLDFVHKDSGKLRELSRNIRERKIREFIELFVSQLKKVTDSLGLDFSVNRTDIKYCTILHGRAVYIFRVYYEKNSFVKIEINFVEKFIYKPKEMSIKAITDFFDSKELLFILGLSINNFIVLSYSLEEIILEKYRAILTRNELKDRDLFDLYLIPDSLKVKTGEVVKKIEYSYLIKRGLKNMILNKLTALNEEIFFKSDEAISDLAIVKYDTKEFERFKEKIKPLLIEICLKFIKANKDK